MVCGDLKGAIRAARLMSCGEILYEILFLDKIVNINSCLNMNIKFEMVEIIIIRSKTRK